MSGPIMAFAGQALNVVGTLAAGRQADAVGNRNADILNQQADATRAATNQREQLLRDRSAKALSDQRAALAANGVSPTTGSALIGVAQNTQDAELDALTLRYEGLLQGRDLNMQADQARYMGKAAKIQSRWSAAGQLLSASSSYLNQKQMPAPVETRTPTPNPYFKG